MSACTPDPTALAVLVPEAEPLVSALRDAHDPSASAGMPAHITLVYPFAPAARVDREMEEGLAGLFAGMSAFPFQSPGHGRRIPTRFSVLAEVAGSGPGRVGVG